ncbi:hypothetical protein MLD38_012019 [Melastoma candidum]|uniref:Uncharacterized protein n=1 Tax=Melastoma candidum TaxID=119954 RepID=A0ACB9R529_9MYRT|nr:hypothetical protein MLD38_012019 [Melastoma candidum]
MAKKHKKTESEQRHPPQADPPEAGDLLLRNGDHEKKISKKKRKKGRDGSVDLEPNKENRRPTVSIALPGSIIDNAQSLVLATRLAGEVARAATIFRIEEVVVFDSKDALGCGAANEIEAGVDDYESGAAFLIRILRYLETPQYLRKALFPKHNSLRYVGVLPPLDAPHHLRMHEWAPYREGVTQREKPLNTSLTLVDVGLRKNVCVNQVLEPGVRVTVAMGDDRNMEAETPRQVVSSSAPREEAGMYWGYKVRYASNLSAVVNDCPYLGGYDYLIGTSEHGQVVKSSELVIPHFRHLLIAFGGLAGLEESMEEDKGLMGKTAEDFFDVYLNTCPHQGSRTIRTEEAILISLQFFQEPIDRAQKGSDK